MKSVPMCFLAVLICFISGCGSQAELERVEQRLRFARDRIGVEVRDAHSAWSQAYLRFEQARLSLDLARELAGRREDQRRGRRAPEGHRRGPRGGQRSV